jgi:hypothetical protein
MFDIFFRDKVFREIPSFSVAGRNELELDFPFLFGASFWVQSSQVALTVVTDDFENAFVRAVKCLRIRHTKLD